MGVDIIPVYHYGNSRILGFGPRWAWLRRASRSMRVALGAPTGEGGWGQGAAMGCTAVGPRTHACGRALGGLQGVRCAVAGCMGGSPGDQRKEGWLLSRHAGGAGHADG